jgi:hypothetical protein
MPQRNGDGNADDREILEVIHWRLFEVMREELGDEEKAAPALRKALLLLVLMTAEAKGDALRSYVDYLLTDFQALAGRFKDNKQDFCRGQAVERARDGGRVTLVLPEKFIKDLLSDLGDG